MKKVLITGSSGYIATEFIEKFRNKYKFVLLSHKKIASHITYDELSADIELIRSIDIIINLAGANIANRRWTQKRKDQLLSSRVNTTDLIVTLFNRLNNKAHIISASATGIYDENKTNDENTLIDYQLSKNFSQTLTKAWETSAKSYQGKLTITRFGVVLGGKGGAFPTMLKPFLFGMGSVLGDGSNYMPWVAIDDLLSSLDYLISNECVGVYNVVAPEINNNNELSLKIATIWHRPRFLRIPVFMIKLLFGQMGKELFLSNIKVLPTRLINEHFEFQHLDLNTTLLAIKNKLI